VAHSSTSADGSLFDRHAELDTARCEAICGPARKHRGRGTWHSGASRADRLIADGVGEIIAQREMSLFERRGCVRNVTRCQ
jgi:hypothetical protein